MKVLMVVEDASKWPVSLPGVEVVGARDYLRSEVYSVLRRAKVYNLCKSYRYQSVGYYVSLLASARGHRPMPSVLSIQDMRLPAIARIASEDLDDLIQKSLGKIITKTFTLSIYFGQNLAKRYARLSAQLFDIYQAPLLRAEFVKAKEKWVLQKIKPIAAADVSSTHGEFLHEAAERYFSSAPRRRKRKSHQRFDLAILFDPEDPTAPSDERAIKRFCKAGEKVGLGVEVIAKSDYSRLAEFDALFIRETTSVNHHTYRFSRSAAAEGLVVIDDPESIVRCTNKVFLAEILSRHQVATPETLIVHKDNACTIVKALGLPCVLKRPDSSDSLGVWKASNEEELKSHLDQLLAKSELVVAQPFLPTDFDWRIGVIDGMPLYACKYHMAKNHWQITQWKKEKANYGRVETLALEEVPTKVIKTAVKAADLIGDGLYGVDIKVVEKTPFVVEVNDNPSIEAGGEDKILGEALYDRIMGVFLSRIEARKNSGQAAHE